MDVLRQVIVFDAAEGNQVDADPAGHPFCIGSGHPSREGAREVCCRSLGFGSAR